MSFREILKELVEGVNGGIAATVMGMDGLSVEQYTAGGQGYDVESLGVEYGKALSEVKNATQILRLGDVEEVSVSTYGMNVFLRLISEDYYIAFAVASGSNSGKARYLLRRAALKAGKELSS